MKVPTKYSQSVPSGVGTVGYLEQRVDPTQGLRALGGALGGLGAVFEEREKKTQRFNALTALSGFETNIAQQQMELKRNAPPDAQGFSKNAEAVFDQQAQDFIVKNVPADLQEEFQARIAQKKQSVMADAFDFQYKAGDAWFEKGVNDELNKARTEIDQNPGALETWQKKMDETISATDLPEITKASLREQVQISLASTEYKAQVRRDAKKMQEIGVGDFLDGELGASTILRKEEGLRLTPYWDKTANRIGYGSDTVTYADGTFEKVKPGMTITREDAERDLARRLSDVEGKKAREQLGEVWNTLSPNVQASLYSVAYNYGSLPSSVVTAAKSGDVEAIATAVESLSANKGRRSNEADIIRGTRGLETDPKYNVIPFDDRVKLRDDAEREAKQQYTAEQQERQRETAAKTNSLYTSLYDGTAGRVEIDKARNEGWLTDYDSIKKADDILEKREETVGLQAAGLEKLTSGMPWSPGNEDDKKMLNAIIGDQGLAKIADGDQSYFNDGVLGVVNQTGIVPQNVGQLLQGMVRGANQVRASFALDALAQLRDVNPLAYNAAIPEGVRSQVDLWDARKGVAKDQGELLSWVRGGTTAAERQDMVNLRKQAVDLLSKVTSGIPKIDELVGQVTDSFDNSIWHDPVKSAIPAATQSLYREFQTAFVDAYSQWGTTEEATAAATKTLKATWDLNPLDNKLMKYPPQKVGYLPSGGSYNWIADQIRSDMKLTPDKEFELFSDQQTEQEWQRYRAGQSAEPPSYRVFYKDENGVMRENVDEDNLPVRLNFKKPEEVLKKEQTQFDLENDIRINQEIIRDIARMQTESAYTGMQLPQEKLEELSRARENLQKLESQKALFEYQNTVPDPEPVMDPMGNPL